MAVSASTGSGGGNDHVFYFEYSQSASTWVLTRVDKEITGTASEGDRGGSEALINRVCDDLFLSSEAINLRLTTLHPRTPLLHLNGVGELCQWFTPNAAGHRQMLVAAGFAVERAVRPYPIPYGSSHPRPGRGVRGFGKSTMQRVLGQGVGVPHAAALVRRAF